jgi:RNA polymerase sigma-70 factor (ECF subfamily)
MTGSRSDAEDVVQEAMLRAHRASVTEIQSPAAYLTTITTRLAIDHLRSARARRESYVGPWLPEPIATDPAPDAATRAVLSDSVTMALLVVLETLSPDERAVLILHDVFAYAHAEVAEILERSEVSCRQLLRRARQGLEAGRPRARVDLARHDEMVRRFIAACNGGDMEGFVALLADDAELIFDGGPEVKTAARHPIRGADRVARFLAYTMARIAKHRCVLPATLNGEPAVLVYAKPGALIGAVFVEPVDDGRVGAIRWVRNPTKLAGLERDGVTLRVR